ncbi:rod shape-determining protein MreC [Lactobacillus mulieris]|jgi:rod shape-determining protein mreC|uniref:Cell shape-determining protein MreC n=2 Tax=Lactobacillus mulieris TaxID=2508708 RepID=A0AAP3GPK7_9LACO|nr:rod shape-determining protein MreC [Lactobacillus mulieris]EEU21171.1 rod shape-determining protein MreC [Lactobacillus jensenii 27-2-CHN]EEX24048.1 rod shape-determining protein MreC [Lactobacillus jensenii 115-3-CHN]EFH29223.1 rod shape-determining protein MreC [Lactobacillus jensenii JV-V16]KAA9245387.1 rod shape-determining protein MreC [Lactobacillus jensenii]KAA9368456.1 rod shape-determining protein MreC [Lactobacillus jensenii]
MKKFLQNKKILVSFLTTLLVVIILGITVSLRSKRNSPLFFQKMGNDIISVASRVVNWPVSLASDGISNINSIINMQKENDHLKSQVSNLAQTKARNSSLEAENKQLKSALNLKNTLTTYTIVNASVISRSPDTWSDILIIDKGSSSGIKKNQAVMSGGGVIGRILEVNSATSKVELITTTDKSANRFSVEADAANGKKVHGIITVNSDDTNSLYFTQVVDSKKLKKGAKVYTSGLGGRSPKGLLVGTVAKTTRDSFGLSDLIEIKPAGSIGDASVVSVVERKVSE